MRKLLLVILVLGITSEFAVAQTPPETPDWTGYYDADHLPEART